MCLITRNPEILTAEKDLTCYKLMRKSLISYSQNYQYALDKPECLGEELEPIPLNSKYSYADSIVGDFYNITDPDAINYRKCGLFSVSKGFHSYATIERVEHLFRINNIFNHLIIVECIIPKGGKYVVDETDLMVSDEIIPKKVVYL